MHGDVHENHVKLLKKFKKELKLTDAFIGHKISEKWTILDYILYRQGNEVEFKIISVGEDKSFVTEEGRFLKKSFISKSYNKPVS